jgi:hypothetical protein
MHSTLPHAVLGALACPDAARFVPERHAVTQVSSERNIVRNKFSSYNLSAYGPNGFVRYFKGSVGTNAAALDVHSRYGIEEGGSIRWRITNVAENGASVSVLDAYTGDAITRFLRPHETVRRRALAVSVLWLVRPHRHGGRGSQLPMRVLPVRDLPMKGRLLQPPVEGFDA